MQDSGFVLLNIIPIQDEKYATILIALRIFLYTSPEKSIPYLQKLQWDRTLLESYILYRVSLIGDLLPIFVLGSCRNLIQRVCLAVCRRELKQLDQIGPILCSFWTCGQ